MSSRVQLALNVADLEASVVFYSTLFGVEPHKRRPGYANFAIAEPPLKLVLIEVTEQTRGSGVQGALNHLGVEVPEAAKVEKQAGRLRNAGLAAFDEKDTTGCYALQDKVCFFFNDTATTEIYTIKDDDPANPESASGPLPVFESRAGDGACCTPAAGFETASVGASDPAQCC